MTLTMQDFGKSPRGITPNAPLYTFTPSSRGAYRRMFPKRPEELLGPGEKWLHMATGEVCIVIRVQKYGWMTVVATQEEHKVTPHDCWLWAVESKQGHVLPYAVMSLFYVKQEPEAEAA